MVASRVVLDRTRRAPVWSSVRRDHDVYDWRQQSLPDQVRLSEMQGIEQTGEVGMGRSDRGGGPLPFPLTLVEQGKCCVLPAEGSSKNRISGSSAMARATAARFRMPPLSCEGLYFSNPLRPTCSSLIRTITSIVLRSNVVCSSRGSAMFSPSAVSQKYCQALTRAGTNG